MRKKVISKKQNNIAIGYCHYGGHRVYMTKEAFKEHDCLGKGCRFFQRFDSVSYWVSYYNDIKRKKLRKFYAKNRGFWLNQGYSIEEFYDLCRNYYGSLTKIPFNRDTNKIDISDFLEELGYSLR